MRFNLGVFSQINRYNSTDLFPVESDGFTGVFWGLHPSPRPGSSGLAGGVSGNVRVMRGRFFKNVPVVICGCRETSDSAAEDFKKISGARAEDSGKSLNQLLKISKNVRVPN